MTPGKDYTMAIKEIALCYKDFVLTKTIGVKTEMFSIFPNPVIDGELFIQLKNGVSGPITIEILDINGKLMKMQKSLINDGENLKLSTGALSSGLYFVKLIQGEAQEVQKIIIK